MSISKLSLSLALLTLAGSARAQELATEPLMSVNGEDFYSWTEYTRSAAFMQFGLRCGMKSRQNQLAGSTMFRAPSDCSLSNTTIRSMYEPGNGIVYEIPVVFHVLSNASGSGNLGKSRITSQIDILNEDFQALVGTPGANGTNAKIHFYLAKVDPIGNPTSGIDRVTNNSWFDDSGNYKSALAWDTNRYLNIYTNKASGSLGYAILPGSGVVGSTSDGVVLLYSAVGRDGSIGPPYDQGRTGTHEVGHYFGLDHTFSGGCAGGSCYQSGDLICDTNAESAPRFGCPSNPQSCGNKDPFRNYLDYTDDLCMREFTPEQVNRMRCTIESWRPSLHTPETTCGSSAAAVVRNAGMNPNVYSATAPIVGLSQDYVVSTSPYDSAIIVGYSAPATTLLGGGQTALVDLSSTKLFQIGPRPGPNVVESISIPPDPALCGFVAHTQAILIGGAPSFALTNAVDMTLGD
jgi:hypothetical protein